MKNLFFPDKKQGIIEQGKVAAIDRISGRVSLFLRNGLTSSGTYIYNLDDLRVGDSVLVTKVSNSYIILNKIFANSPLGSGVTVHRPQPTLPPSGTFYPVTQYADNGYWKIETGSFLYFNNVMFGCYDSNVHFNTFVRFPAPTIPVGATITACALILTASAALAVDVCNANIYFNNIDNAIAPTTVAGANALVLTAPVSWNALDHGVRLTTLPYDTHTSPDLSSLLQSIVSRPGYVQGNALQLIIKDNGSDVGAWRNFWPKIDGAPDYVAPPALHVEWIVG